MKKLLIFLLALSLTLSCSLSLADEGGMSMLRAQGTTIVNAQGEPVLLRGVNMGGWLVQEAWMNLTNAPSQMESFAVLDERFGREER